MDSATLHYLSESSNYISLQDYDLIYRDKNRFDDDIIDISDVKF